MPFFVIYLDDDGRWHCSHPFDTYDEACDYADGVAPSRMPMVYERSTYRRR